jgi:hypothetical protein
MKKQKYITTKPRETLNTQNKHKMFTHNRERRQRSTETETTGNSDLPGKSGEDSWQARNYGKCEIGAQQ